MSEKFRVSSIHEYYYNVYLREQDIHMQKTLSKEEYKVGKDFQQFLLEIIPYKKPKDWEKQPLIVDIYKNNYLETIWNKQSNFWAQIETPATYMAIGSTIERWLETICTKTNANTITSVGVGPGLYELFWEHTLKQKNIEAKIYGSDFVQNMVQEAEKNKERYYNIHKKYPEVFFSKLDIQKEKIPQTDICICNNTLNWMPQWESAIINMIEGIKKGGFLILSTCPTSPVATAEDVVIPLNKEINPFKIISLLLENGMHLLDKNILQLPIGYGQGGHEVVRVGFGVIHGGYAGGIMQAVSEGAQEAIEKGNLSPKFNLGIPEERFDQDWPRVSKASFSKPAADIFDRLRLVTLGDIVIIAPIGGDGTALELDIVIHENLLAEYTGAPIKPIIFLLTETGTDWKKFLESRSLLATNANIFEKSWLYFADSSEQVMGILSKLMK